MKHAIRHLLWASLGLALLPGTWALGQANQSNATKQQPAAATSSAPEKTAAVKPVPKPATEKVATDPKPATPTGETKKATEKADKPAEPTKGDAKKAEAEKCPTAEPSTYTVKKTPLRIRLTLRGTFEAQATNPIAVRLKEWKSLKVLKAVPHGTRVKKGEVLVQFDTEDIERAIADLRTDQQLASLQFKQSEASLRYLEASTPMQLAAAERNKRIADEDLVRFLGTDRPLSEKAEDFMLKMSQNTLQYEEEELRQLEKMYKADDLTEETEEIILKRQRDTVDRAKFSAEIAKVFHQQAMKVQLPREEENRKQASRREGLDLERVQATLPVALEQQKLELEKLKVHRGRSQERLKKLLADRDAMKVVATTDGVVYYGQFTRGDWNGASGAADDLHPGGDVTSGQVFMMVVQTRPMVFRATVSERDLHWMRPGMAGIVEATGYPELKLSAALSKVDAFPAIGGKFETLFSVNLDKSADVLVPEMTGTIKLVPYLNKEALAIPAAALFTEELDDQQQYVYVLPKDGKPKKQPVTAGKKSDDRVEIVKGLAVGDRILLEKPKDKEDAAK